MNALAKILLPSVVPPLGYALITTLRRTMRIDYENREIIDGIRGSGSSYIVAFWHSRWLMMPYGHLSPRLSVISSTHRDGAMLGSILQRFGVDLSRGSSTHNGAAGLLSLVRKARLGFDLAITPDGPKGPSRKVKPGVISAAKLTGLAIVPVAFSAYPAFRIDSWDRTLIPKPFSCGVFRYGEPILIPREAEAKEDESFRLHLEEMLNRMTDGLDRDTGVGIE